MHIFLNVHLLSENCNVGIIIPNNKLLMTYMSWIKPASARVCMVKHVKKEEEIIWIKRKWSG